MKHQYSYTTGRQPVHSQSFLLSFFLAYYRTTHNKTTHPFVSTPAGQPRPYPATAASLMQQICATVSGHFTYIHSNCRNFICFYQFLLLCSVTAITKRKDFCSLLLLCYSHHVFLTYQTSFSGGLMTSSSEITRMLLKTFR